MDNNLVVRTVKSVNSGEYVPALLSVGRYRLTAHAPGFKKLIRLSYRAATGGEWRAASNQSLTIALGTGIDPRRYRSLKPCSQPAACCA